MPQVVVLLLIILLLPVEVVLGHLLIQVVEVVEGTGLQLDLI